MKRGLVLRKALACVAVASIASTAMAAPEFLAYEGRNSIHEGQGGEKKTLNGIDFWMNGDPPHRFQVLGSLIDRRHKTGIYGMIRMSSLDDDIAKAAKAAGGDAVILRSQDDDVIGVAGSAYATGGWGWGTATGLSRPIEAHDSQYVVVKYLPDDPSAPPPAVPIPPPAQDPAPVAVRP